MAAPSHDKVGPGFPPDLVAAVLADALAARGGPGDALPVPAAPVLGITGLQGSGKSTLAAQVARLAKRHGLQAVVLSLDDFYLTRRERRALAQRVHPLLATRGPPGTHDVALACATLGRLRTMADGETATLPVFDKLSDQRLSPSRWKRVHGRPDLIVFEGWFLGVTPEAPEALGQALNRREREEDSDGRWRGYCNEALAGYAPLWRAVDRLLWLKGPGFDCVPNWRWQQELALQQANPGKQAMTRAQIEDFVLLFERVSRHSLRVLPDISDAVLDIDAQRRCAAM